MSLGTVLTKLALSNVGVVDPTQLKEYIAQGGLAALRKAQCHGGAGNQPSYQTG